ncbi:MAG: Hsp20/alpha crystallin family protein [Bacteroidales bacterium]|nr:Hsp20/alpha crystallin family protein [Bacteroidales bacterium]MDD2322409.1 Hsp20/alpha crystallin family protein [Bacteroidales bacterium]MDD3011310.1 Hsp20/alpha crystallin family protein [Bacteroidales bacterium]MDD3961012.1 Hsp20/alpha crystallin family protein [Bacteroidales bacterium]MDY0284599.1 Hsp20/alpha crystallin family protein [Bacteroidales bacterium]
MSLVRFSNQLPGLFDRFFDNELFDWSNRNFSTTNTTLPSVNIKEDVDGYEVEMAAPGLTKKDFCIELNNNTLTISSEKKEEKEEKDDQLFTRKEFSYQSFRRSFTLPATVESDKIAAKYDNGILKVSIPKKEEAKPKPAKQIEIR